MKTVLYTSRDSNRNAAVIATRVVRLFETREGNCVIVTDTNEHLTAYESLFTIQERLDDALKE